MCDKDVDKCPFVSDFAPCQYQTQEMCDKIVSDDAFKLKYCHNRCKTQEMYKKSVDYFLPALKYVPDWLVTTKMIENLPTALYADENVLYFNKDSDNAIYSCNEMAILRIDLNNVNLDDTNYDKDDPETIIQIRFLAWHIKFEKHKALKKELNEELMLVALQFLHVRR